MLSRYGVLVTAILAICQHAIDQQGLRWLTRLVSVSSNVSWWTTIAIELIAGIVAVMSIFAIFAYAVHLARRIPNMDLADHTNLVMWGFCLSLAAMNATELALLIWQRMFAVQDPVLSILDKPILFFTLLIPLTLFACLTGILLFRYLQDLHVVIGQARRRRPLID